MNTDQTKSPKILLGQILKDRKISQKEFAAMAGVDKWIVSRWATGKPSQISLKILGRFADALGLDPGALIG